MATLWKGQPVALAVTENLSGRISALKERGIEPQLGIVRVGQRPDDLSYEKGVIKRAEALGISIRQYLFPEEVAQAELLSAIQEINQDHTVHGVLIFRPMPAHIDDQAVRNTLLASKDLDGITNDSMAGVYSGTRLGFPPCTPAACMKILEHYGVDLAGKKAVVIGRSLVVGKPAALMLIKKDATVTVCHTKTKDLAAVCREADILIAAAGKAETIGAEYCRPGQVVIDVGIHVREDGSLCGDVDFPAVEPLVDAITPVPGGVGAVTTSILLEHLVDAAERTAGTSA